MKNYDKFLEELKTQRSAEREKYGKELKREIEAFQRDYGERMSLFDEDYDATKRDIGLDFVVINDVIISISTIDTGVDKLYGERFETMFFIEGESKVEDLPVMVRPIIHKRITYTTREEAENSHKRFYEELKNLSKVGFGE